MQHLKDDMDEIFRLAAEHYPLKTDSADWQAMRQRLAADEAAFKVRISVKQSLMQLGVLAILIFVPFGIAVTNFVFTGKAAVNTETIKPAAQNITAIIDAKENTGVHTRQHAPATAAANGQVYIPGDAPALFFPGKKDVSIIHEAPANLAGSGGEAGLQNEHTAVSLVTAKEEVLPEVQVAGNSIAGNDNIQAEQPANKSRKQKATTAKQKHFYAGAVAAPELTRVKSQPVSKTGFNMGVVMGYNFRNHLQLEMGVVLAHKYFYTDGRYTAPKTLRKDDAEIKDVDGFTSITEIPVTLRYNMSKDANPNNIYASAGLVSYVVHKEQYRFSYEKDGVNKRGSKKYSKSADKLFSNVQLSAGYERKVGKAASFRIEPYYRIPFNGVGISDVPVTSVGVNVGFITYLK